MTAQRGLRDLAIVGLGELLWDLLPSGRQLGGAPANFAVMASRLGAHGIIASRIGDDELGHAARATLKALPIDTRYLQRDAAGHPTGSVTVALLEGQPEYTIHAPVAWDFLQLTASWLELAGRADAVCFGGLAQRSAGSRETIHAFLQATRPECVRVFDVNFRRPFVTEEAVRASLVQATILKLNDGEMAELLALSGLAGADTDPGIDPGIDSGPDPRPASLGSSETALGEEGEEAAFAATAGSVGSVGPVAAVGSAAAVRSAALQGYSARVDWLARSAQRLLERWPMHLVAITLGAHGSLLVTREEVARHPGVPTTVVDAVGAGDAFTAALTAYYLQGPSQLDAARLALLNEAGNRWGSWVASQAGAMPQLPEDVLQGITSQIESLQRSS